MPSLKVSKPSQNLLVQKLVAAGVLLLQHDKQRAGLQFPPVRAERFLRNAHCTGREYNGGLRGAIGSGSSVYLAAVLEYLAAEILELAGNCARDQRRTRITPRCLYIAMQNDYELTNLVKRVKWQFYRGGVVPNIHAALLPERR